MPIIPPPPPTLIPSPNLRTANDLMVEISLHLVEDIVNTALTQPIIAGSPATAFVGSVVGMYAGAQVVITNSTPANPPSSNDVAIITILSFDPSTNSFTANFLQDYGAGSTLLGGTFPTQQPTDPFFTQTEVLNYLAQAQNEFLVRCPLIFDKAYQDVLLGVEIQPVPPTAIELERISINGVRLLEVSQTELSMQDPEWFYDNSDPTPLSWFEDRTGFYGFGLSPVPQAQFQCLTWISQRGPEVLNLLSNFLIPDAAIHGVKYRTLSILMSKNGEQASPTMARLYQKRFESTVAIMSRFLDGVINAPGKRA